MLTQRQFMILYLFWQKNNVLTSSEFAKLLHISERTIKNELASINSMSETYGFIIDAKRSLGYQIKILNQTVYQKEIIAKLSCYSDVKEIPFDEEKRMYSTLCILFLYPNITINDIASSLFIDKRSLQKTLQSIRILLQRYQLTLVSKKKCGISIQGRELFKRLCIIDLYTHYHHITALIRKDALYQNYFIIEEEKRRAIRNICRRSIREENYHIKDIHFEKFVYHLLLSYHRHQQGYTINLPQTELQRIRTWDSYPLVLSLRKQLHEQNLLEIDENEISYLSIILFCSLDIHSIDEISKYPDLYLMCQKAIQLIKTSLAKQQTFLYLPDDFIEQFLCVLFPIVVRMHYHIYEDNKWLHQWRFKNIYTSLISLELGFLSMQTLANDMGSTMAHDDITQLAYLFQMLIQKQQYSTKHQKILIVSASGYSSMLLVKQNILKDFSYCIDSIDIRERHTIQEENDVGNYDVLISSFEYCRDFEGQIPIIYETDILSYKYQKFHHKLTGASSQMISFLSQIKNFDFIEMETATSIEEILSHVYHDEGHDRIVHETKMFHERENLIFNQTSQHHVGHFHFLEEYNIDRFCIVTLHKPMIWKHSVIHVIIICSIYPDSYLKCRFYDDILTTLLQNEDALKYVMQKRSKKALLSILH